jgi:hypothetical protein
VVREREVVGARNGYRKSDRIYKRDGKVRNKRVGKAIKVKRG